MRLLRDLPTVLYSVETMSREFEAKLVMAATLAGNGCRAVVAHKETAQLVARESRRLVWQGSIRGHDPDGVATADALRRNGSALMFHEDEGAIFPGASWTTDILRKHEIEFLRTYPTDRICTWGVRQQKVVTAAAPPLESKVVVTGTPRLDLCSHTFDWVDAQPDDEKRSRCGRYILVNTRFAKLVHSNGYQGQFAMFNQDLGKRKAEDSGQQREAWFSKWRNDGHDFVEYLMLIKELAQGFPKYTVVVRPHPSESIDFYKEALASFGNVVVNRSYSVLYWIRGAELVVHNNCTTGIEAVLAGRPVLHFLPGGASTGDMEVAKEAGWTTASLDDALAAAEQMLAGHVPTQVWSESAKDVLLNLTNASIPMLAAATLDLIRERNLLSSDVALPRSAGRHFADWFRRSKNSSYVLSKRGAFDPRRVEAIVDGCRTAGISRANVLEVKPTYLVVEPA